MKVKREVRVGAKNGMNLGLAELREACRTNLDIPSLSLNSELLQQTGELNTKRQPKNNIFQFSQALMRI